MFSFGVLADAQAADKDTLNTRAFRAAFDRLEDCVADLSTQALAFTIQLGDLIEEGSGNLDRAVAILNRLETKVYHVTGNHDFAGVTREEYLRKTEMPSRYYDFACEDWRFIVLDSVDISPSVGWPEDSENHRQGAAWLEKLLANGSENAYDWNGAIGQDQLGWLGRKLERAKQAGEKAVVFSHLPVLAEASHPAVLMWNHSEVLDVLESFDCVKAIFCGHGHEGGYAFRNGIHHVTMQAIVDAPEENAYAVVEVHPGKLEVCGVGRVPGRTLLLE